MNWLLKIDHIFTDKGEVFGWGNSEYSQFKMVTEEQQINKSVKLDMGPVGKVIDIASGGSMCMVLNGMFLQLKIKILLMDKKISLK